MAFLKEIELDKLVDDYDWKEVFGGNEANNVKDKCDPCPPDADGLDLTPPLIADVVEIIAAVNGENDGEEWAGIFRLKDSRFLFATGWCDYSGWNCVSRNSLEVAGSLGALLAYGVSKIQLARLEGKPITLGDE